MKKAKKESKNEIKPIEIYYQNQEEVQEVAKRRVLDHLYDLIGMENMNKSRVTKRDAFECQQLIANALDLFHTDFVTYADTIGAYHARIIDHSCLKSKTERKGIRGCIKVKIERHGKEDKETNTSYYPIFPCESIVDLVDDITSSLAMAVYEWAKKDADKYNRALEKNCGCTDSNSE